ncbi:MAG TPA: hypothetical protein VLA94_06085, partial [Syntrophales bacterium]|nr:hypothetical protein [Syntrophales bacterium]
QQADASQQANSQQPTANSQQPTANSQQIPAVYFLFFLSAVDCRLWTVGKKNPPLSPFLKGDEGGFFLLSPPWDVI